jgi:hypothetical protein
MTDSEESKAKLGPKAIQQCIERQVMEIEAMQAIFGLADDYAEHEVEHNEASGASHAASPTPTVVVTLPGPAEALLHKYQVWHMLQTER